jgi:hypothetical protein
MNPWMINVSLYNKENKMYYIVVSMVDSGTNEPAFKYLLLRDTFHAGVVIHATFDTVEDATCALKRETSSGSN